jgi:hypothetical protein
MNKNVHPGGRPGEPYMDAQRTTASILTELVQATSLLADQTQKLAERVFRLEDALINAGLGKHLIEVDKCLTDRQVIERQTTK